MYAMKASTEFNNWLHDELTQLSDEVRLQLGANLIALVLGGGYGRGEGGVISDAGREFPYNDLDFVLIVKRKNPDIAALVHQASLPFIKRLRIEIDFSRPLTIDDIHTWPNWMMWHDLLNGHQVLCGPADILTANAPTRMRESLPLIEGTRLLLNRGAGLLWALRVESGAEIAPDADFIRRNYFKCLLALGDALLIADGCYTTRYSGRDTLLDAVIAAHPAFADWGLPAPYRTALNFKFSPDAVPQTPPSRTSLQDLAELWGKVWLAVEQQRSGQNWQSIDAYCHWRGLREPEEHQGLKLLRNLLLNTRRGCLSLSYPREELYRQLPLLLQTPIDADNWRADTADFLSVWQRYN